MNKYKHDKHTTRGTHTRINVRDQNDDEEKKN